MFKRYSVRSSAGARNAWLVVIVLVAVMLAGPAVAQINNQNQADANDKATVVGQLQTRHYLVTVHAGPSGPLYTVTDENGQVQGIKMSPELLAERFPILKSIIDNPPADAGLYRELQQSPVNQ